MLAIGFLFEVKTLSILQTNNLEYPLQSIRLELLLFVLLQDHNESLAYMRQVGLLLIAGIRYCFN